jgi:ubiquinone/menaquinone biosynthesis C-methylase UbiE
VKQVHATKGENRFEEQTLEGTLDEKAMSETRAFWDRVAADWLTQVGDEGDANRRLNSDPVLWQFLGDVRGRAVLDAGCGTGYLTKKLVERGAAATGVDFSEQMIAIARKRYPDIDFRVDSCSELKTVADRQVDLVIANYVLMDTPDLSGTLRAFHRVLKDGGAAVVVFSHPCFPQGGAEDSADGEGVTYAWHFPYFEERKLVDPPWAHFRDEFIWFHRPLSDYWKAFKAAGFLVEEFEEPRVTPERYHLAPSARKREKSKARPYSVAFRLRKPHESSQPEDEYLTPAGTPRP